MELAQPQIQVAALRAVSNGRATAVILTASAAIFAFLIWLLYWKQPIGGRSAIIGALPAVDAALNGLSTVLLSAGLVAVLRRRFTTHMRFMFAAAVSSALFLACYLTYHTIHGSTLYQNHGTVIRPVYFAVLTSHIVLSGVALPLILASFFLSLSGRYSLHRRVSRFTFPIWLYVSVTGVAVFAFLKFTNHP
jgi:putative membrane protein